MLINRQDNIVTITLFLSQNDVTRGEVTAEQQTIKQAENVFIRDRLRIKLHSIAEFINFDIKYQNNYLKF